jgi:transposase
MTCDTAPLIPPQEATICVALELSRSTWLVGINVPGSEKISKHTVVGGDGAALLALLAKVKDKAEHQLGRALRLVVIQEAGRDGFWIHRLLEAAGIQSQIVDPASIAVPRRHRRAKTGGASPSPTGQNRWSRSRPVDAHFARLAAG